MIRILGRWGGWACNPLPGPPNHAEISPSARKTRLPSVNNRYVPLAIAVLLLVCSSQDWIVDCAHPGVKTILKLVADGTVSGHAVKIGQFVGIVGQVEQFIGMVLVVLADQMPRAGADGAHRGRRRLLAKPVVDVELTEVGVTPGDLLSAQDRRKVVPFLL